MRVRFPPPLLISRKYFVVAAPVVGPEVGRLAEQSFVSECGDSSPLSSVAERPSF
ncbi:MAG TPA: hypothetical protein VF278_23985 [Pirellulales bacterium]